MEIADAVALGLKTSYMKQIHEIFAKYPEIEKAVVYGSRAKGNYKPYSDIDITLVGKLLNLTIQYKIENDLDDLLLPYKIDLSIFHKIDNKDLSDHITRVGKYIYFKENTDT